MPRMCKVEPISSVILLEAANYGNQRLLAYNRLRASRQDAAAILKSESELTNEEKRVVACTGCYGGLAVHGRRLRQRQVPRCPLLCPGRGVRGTGSGRIQGADRPAGRSEIRHGSR